MYIQCMVHSTLTTHPASWPWLRLNSGEYGYFVPHHTPVAPQPGYTLSLSLDASDRLLDDKRDVVENNAGLSESMSFNLAPGTEPSETLLGFLRLINLKGR